MPSMIKFLSKIAQLYIDRRYPGWSLDVALRYLPIVKDLNRVNPANVLDVGSGYEGLCRYWGRPAIEFDLSFPQAGQAFPAQRVQGTGSALPFKHRAFDAVVCADVLEHIPVHERDQVISELLRIAGKDLIIAVPCGEKARQADKMLNEIHMAQRGTPHPFLGEHLQVGLPDAAMLEKKIRRLAGQQGRKVDIRVTKNVTVRLWQWLFKQYLTGGFRKQRIISYYCLFFIPLFRTINWGETYRKIFFVKLNDS